MVTLHGYRYSVYTWIARLALFEKGVGHRTVEVNPFAAAGHPAHPFGRVPLLDHDGFRLYETGAITRYVDAAFSGRVLHAAEPRQRARIDQVIGIVDSYVYWPLVRQVAAHGYFHERGDADEVRAGLATAPRILAALDDVVAEQGLLRSGALSLADIHLAPMIAYFTLVPAAAALLSDYPTLARWWGQAASVEGVLATWPDLSAIR